MDLPGGSDFDHARGSTTAPLVLSDGYSTVEEFPDRCLERRFRSNFFQASNLEKINKKSSTLFPTFFCPRTHVYRSRPLS